MFLVMDFEFGSRLGYQLRTGRMTRSTTCTTPLRARLLKEMTRAQSAVTTWDGVLNRLIRMAEPTMEERTCSSIKSLLRTRPATKWLFKVVAKSTGGAPFDPISLFCQHTNIFPQHLHKTREYPLSLLFSWPIPGQPCHSLARGMVLPLLYQGTAQLSCISTGLCKNLLRKKIWQKKVDIVQFSPPPARKNIVWQL